MDDSSLRFNIYERIHLDTNMNGIRLIESTELTPQIKMHLCKDQVKLVGNLLLKITYVGVIPFQTSDFQHKIPVEIIIPAIRVKDAWLIDADIENFDVDIVGTHAINVSGKLVVYEKESSKMEKVQVKKGFKEAIETMQAKGETLYQIVQHHATGDLMRVNGFPIVEAMSGDQLIRALYIGYEVEETPQDKVREYYNQQNSICTERMDTGADVIRKVLNLLGKEIEGVNV